MKQLKIAGLCLVSMLAMSTAMTATASAVAWQACREGGASTKYSEDQCLAASSSGAWGWEEIKGTEKVKGVGFSLMLEDIKTPLGVAAIECTSESGEGIVGPGNKSEVLTAKIEASKCRALKVCENVESIETLHLPWQTEIFETEKKVLGKAKGTGAGEPGLRIKCKTILGSKTDECVAETGKEETATLEDVATKNGTTVELLVLTTAEHKQKQDCTEGGKESGEISGLGAILLSSGAGLRVH